VPLCRGRALPLPWWSCGSERRLADHTPSTLPRMKAPESSRLDRSDRLQSLRIILDPTLCGLILVRIDGLELIDRAGMCVEWSLSACGRPRHGGPEVVHSGYRAGY
jgi:hypothetical protein